VFFKQRTFRARARAVLAASPGRLSPSRRRPWDLLNPSQCLPDPAGECASSASRAHLPFRRPVHREFHRRGTPLFTAGRRTARPRLLGFGPGGQSCRVVVATPPWLCEQGRPGAAAWTALGFVVLSQVFGRRPLAAASGGLPPVGFSPRPPRRNLQMRPVDVAVAGGPFGVVRGRRLAGPAVRSPPVPASLSEVFAPSAGGCPTRVGTGSRRFFLCRRTKGVRDVSFRGLGAGRNEPLTELQITDFSTAFPSENHEKHRLFWSQKVRHVSL